MAIAAALVTDRDTPAGVLSLLQEAREAARRDEIAMMVAALDWAAMHSVDSLDDAATVPGTDRALPIAGEGAPLVAEFAIVELAPALGRSADSARLWLGTTLEIRHRLPRVWRRLLAGPLEPWKARQIAASTLSLGPDAAGWVDAQVAPVAHKVGPAQLERIIAEAIRRFDPERAHAEEVAAAEHRHATVHDRLLDGGCLEVTAILDAIDGHDLDLALGKRAHTLLAAGSTESLDVRRAQALGELARHELALDFTTDQLHDTASTASTGGTGERAGERAGRDATLYVHLDQQALDALQTEHGADRPDRPERPVALVEKTGAARDYPLGLDRLREWLTRPGTTISIRPVLDLTTPIQCAGYQPSDRLREQVILRNPTCVFPFCTRRARGADLDHIHPHEHGGPTSSDNLAPLCRLHHRAKTHGRWTYTPLAPGQFRWRGPHGQTFLVDPTGTTTLPEQPPPQDPPDPAQRHPHRP
jgi:hypothetical protein